MRWLLFSAGFFLFCIVVRGNNIRVNGEARVVDFTGSGRDTAIVEFGVSWDNSWRDDFNWDAAWLFLKYKKRGLTSAWEHAYLSREGHENKGQHGDTGNYSFMVGEVGEGASSKVTGLFLMRDGISEGSVDVKVRLKWPLQGNSRLPLTASDFGENLDSIFIAAYAVEMVYVPYGAYILGDGFSNKTFNYTQRDIPVEENLIGRAGFTYSASSVYNGEYLPTNALPAAGTSHWCSASQNTEDWWQVDFGTPKEISYFAVGNVYGTVKYGYLEGSDTGNSSDWNILWSGGSGCWPTTSAYPIPQRIKITNPRAYRYYRLRMKTDTWNGIYYVAMSDKKGDDQSYIFISDEGALSKGELSLPVSYPKGYRGFYAMKYEVSQEQYVEFLNSLTLSQQKNRVMNNDFEHMSKGDYVFGDRKRPNCRNGIAFLMQKGAGTPALFGNNLNPDNKFYSADDGQTLACNYLSPADMLAYCDWSGLRPMSELEYEKSCRRPSPQIPDKGEYAWNSNSGVNRLRTFSDLTGSQTARETPFDYKVNVNAGNRVNGPVRSGAFATSRTGQQESGATYWGLMEMSGNLWELCYNANSSGSVFKGDNLSYSHGDGNLNADGTTDIGASYWPSAVSAFGVRGGSFASEDNLLRTSDRTYAEGSYFSALTKRDSSVGFRGVRSMLNTSGFTAGRIYCANGLERDTACSGEIYIIDAEDAKNSIGKLDYRWYMSEDNGLTWSLLEGEGNKTLTYEKIENKTTAIKILMFKCMVSCAVGEEMSNEVTLLIPSLDFAVTPLNLELYSGNYASGSFVVNPASGNFAWTYAGNIISNASTYKPDSVDFGADFRVGETLNLFCTRSIGKCSLTQKVEVYVSSWGCGVPIVDRRDGKVHQYGTAKFGNQCWMTNNMRLDAEGKYCYDNVAANCETYGGMYTLYAARVICPEGWHLPSDAEWEKLKSYTVNFGNELVGWRYDDGRYCCSSSAYWWSTNQSYWANSGASVNGPYGGYGPYSAMGVRCVKDLK